MYWSIIARRSLYWLLFAPLAAATASVENIPSEEWTSEQLSGRENNFGSQNESCAAACATLHRTFDTDLANTIAYGLDKAAYWSFFQAEVHPACFIQPTNAQDVAEILQVVRRTQCPFAVKSGGHAAFAGASSSPGGITIDLHRLNELSLSDDKTITHVGTGNRWIDVYDYLTPKSLSVIGGRVASIGTGGLTLGGGISFFSGRHGWACDNVVNYELVTASSEILEVNHASHPDLYFALRGGGNNFGIITRLDLNTIPQNPFWGGSLTTSYSSKTRNAAIEALYHYAYNAPKDIDSALYVAFAYSQLPLGSYLIVSELTQAANIPNPPIFENFTSLPDRLFSTLRRDTDMPSLAREINAAEPNGFRETYWTRTFTLPSSEIIYDVLEIFQDEVEAIKHVLGCLPALTLQIIPENVMGHFAQNGGNALGISPDQGPLLLVDITVQWSDAGKDDAVLGAARNAINRSVARAKEIGAYHPYIYQNYAAQEQEVFEGYGEENLEQLRQISKRWDPEGVFQVLQPGYFKLW
ncbi:FAD-binding domain-containing [Lecanosticta acicola]|uniref:FAD-binding domain-containing n=1 Tax=Lecanosticta acicola TaxID=111012 RepID=A0AAI9EDT4_9PEZI|nr:FAD-binding domain-containing [Lecanosticta acicola]